MEVVVILAWGSGDGRRGSLPEVVGGHGASLASSRRRWRPSGLRERFERERESKNKE